MKATRLKVIFVLLALVLLVPLFFLVRAGLDSVDLERDFRHRIVAQQIIDEMERELTAFLTAEEDRPYAHYRYYLVRPGGFDLEVSPLAYSSRESFVVGHFQIEPDGSFSSPLVPRNLSLAASKSGWVAQPETAERVGRIRASLDGLWGASGARQDRRDLATGDQLARQSPGSTVALARTKNQKIDDEPGAQSKHKELQSQEAAPFRVLENLKTGARDRQERLAKVETTDASNVYNFSQSVENNALQKGDLTDEMTADEGEVDQVGAAIEEALKTRADAAIDVRQEPMVGRQSQDGHLVLYRTVTVGEQAYRQGLVLDLGQLVAWLAERVLSRTEVAARAALALSAGATRSLDSGSTDLGLSESHRFRHRFADPFGSVIATLTLAPLPETRAASYLHLLSAFVALAATLGLFGLYRTVAVSLAYAERRNNFVSAVTHELKTPLTAIRMYGEMLRDGLVTGEEKRQKYYRLLTSESERLSRLLDNVLELAQLEKSARAVDLTIGDVGVVVEEVAETLRPHAEQEGFALVLELEEELPQARFDRDGLKQVLFNLVDNAMKYSAASDRREIVLRCRHRDPEQPDSGLTVSVADHGPGVARQHLQRIFEPFYRPENELTRKSKGTGIGLALVRGLVEQMGGQVRGLNLEGGGFEVRIRLQTG